MGYDKSYETDRQNNCFQSFVSTPKIGISLLAVVGIVKQWFILVRPVRHLKSLSHMPNSLLKPSSKNEIHR